MINQIEPVITEEDIKSVDDYLRSGGWLTEHTLTKSLEENIATYLGRKYAVAVPNGTIAIYLALKAKEIGEGHRVAVPNITMVATINAVLWTGAEPILVDVDESLCMSVKLLQEIQDLDVVIFVPLNGRTGSGEQIENWCLDNKIILIEDSAHALGSNYSNKKCGGLGDISTLSFTPHKIITSGQGGLVLTDDEDLYKKIYDYKSFNRENDASDWHKGFGLNFKFTDLQASIVLSQLKRLGILIDSKKDLFNSYKHSISKSDTRLLNFKDHEAPWFIDFFLMSSESQSTYQDLLFKKGIQVRKGYPPLSMQTMFSKVERTDLSYSEEIAGRIIWLPSSFNLSKNDVELISRNLNSI